MPTDEADAPDLRRARERLEILTAIDTAIQRRDEVLSCIYNAPDNNDAISGVSALLDVSSLSARAILQLPLGKFTEAARAAMDNDRSATESALIGDPAWEAGRGED